MDHQRRIIDHYATVPQGSVFVRHEDVLALTRSRPLRELCELLDAAEVPNGPINSIADCFADPHYAARGTLMELDDPVLGPVRMQAPVPRFSATPARVPRPAPEVGELNDEIYRGLLGLDPQRLDELRDQGVI